MRATTKSMQPPFATVNRFLPPLGPASPALRPRHASTLRPSAQPRPSAPQPGRPCRSAPGLPRPSAPQPSQPCPSAPGRRVTSASPSTPHGRLRRDRARRPPHTHGPEASGMSRATVARAPASAAARSAPQRSRSSAPPAPPTCLAARRPPHTHGPPRPGMSAARNVPFALLPLVARPLMRVPISVPERSRTVTPPIWGGNRPRSCEPSGKTPGLCRMPDFLPSRCVQPANPSGRLMAHIRICRIWAIGNDLWTASAAQQAGKRGAGLSGGGLAPRRPLRRRVGRSGGGSARCRHFSLSGGRAGPCRWGSLDPCKRPSPGRRCRRRSTRTRCR
jgi:hypothetical protein